jgi:hypothetical protein
MLNDITHRLTNAFIECYVVMQVRAVKKWLAAARRLQHVV